MKIQPGSPVAQLNLGEAYRRLGQTKAAISAFKRAISIQPQNGWAHNNLGVALRETGEFESATGHFRKAEACTHFGELVRLRPVDAQIQVRYGTALIGHGDWAGAKRVFQEAIRIDPGLACGHDMLASTLQQEGDMELAIRHYQTAIGLDPALARAHSNLGNAYITCGLLDDAVACFFRAFEHDSSLTETYDLLLYWLNYSSKVTMDEIAGAYAAWRKHIVGAIPAMTHPKAGYISGARRLRIGYVSPDFRDHVMARFILPLLENHHRTEFEIFCYYTASASDGITARCREAADHWREIGELSDEQAIRLIHHDRIDILVDLAMHSSGNRLGVFARKPAPVQVTYLSNVFHHRAPHGGACATPFLTPHRSSGFSSDGCREVHVRLRRSLP